MTLANAQRTHKAPIHKSSANKTYIRKILHEAQKKAAGQFTCPAAFPFIDGCRYTSRSRYSRAKASSRSSCAATRLGFGPPGRSRALTQASGESFP